MIAFTLRKEIGIGYTGALKTGGRLAPISGLWTAQELVTLAGAALLAASSMKADLDGTAAKPSQPFDAEPDTKIIPDLVDLTLKCAGFIHQFHEGQGEATAEIVAGQK